ncbi:hypothetical protein EBR96_06290, partial [bacterium]|nr:hypothetical protein [bacterium]
PHRFLLSSLLRRVAIPQAPTRTSSLTQTRYTGNIAFDISQYKDDPTNVVKFQLLAAGVDDQLPHLINTLMTAEPVDADSAAHKLSDLTPIFPKVMAHLLMVDGIYSRLRNGRSSCPGFSALFNALGFSERRADLVFRAPTGRPVPLKMMPPIMLNEKSIPETEYQKVDLSDAIRIFDEALEADPTMPEKTKNEIRKNLNLFIQKIKHRNDSLDAARDRYIKNETFFLKLEIKLKKTIVIWRRQLDSGTSVEGQFAEKKQILLDLISIAEGATNCGSRLFADSLVVFNRVLEDESNGLNATPRLATDIYRAIAEWKGEILKDFVNRDYKGSVHTFNRLLQQFGKEGVIGPNEIDEDYRVLSSDFHPIPRTLSEHIVGRLLITIRVLEIIPESLEGYIGESLGNGTLATHMIHGFPLDFQDLLQFCNDDIRLQIIGRLCAEDPDKVVDNMPLILTLSTHPTPLKNNSLSLKAAVIQYISDCNAIHIDPDSRVYGFNFDTGEFEPVASEVLDRRREKLSEVCAMSSVAFKAYADMMRDEIRSVQTSVQTSLDPTRELSDDAKLFSQGFFQAFYFANSGDYGTTCAKSLLDNMSPTLVAAVIVYFLQDIMIGKQGAQVAVDLVGKFCGESAFWNLPIVEERLVNEIILPEAWLKNKIDRITINRFSGMSSANGKQTLAEEILSKIDTKTNPLSTQSINYGRLFSVLAQSPELYHPISFSKIYSTLESLKKARPDLFAQSLAEVALVRCQQWNSRDRTPTDLSNADFEACALLLELPRSTDKFYDIVAEQTVGVICRLLPLECDISISPALGTIISVFFTKTECFMNPGKLLFSLRRLEDTGFADLFYEMVVTHWPLRFFVTDMGTERLFSNATAHFLRRLQRDTTRNDTLQWISNLSTSEFVSNQTLEALAQIVFLINPEEDTL